MKRAAPEPKLKPVSEEDHMSTATALKTNTPVSFLQEQARKALKLFKERSEADQKLEQMKGIFRQAKQNIVVAGVGKVTVKKPGGGKLVEAHDEYVFDLAKFNDLPAAQREKLMKLGVVTRNHIPAFTTPKTAAAVVFELNV